MLRKCLTSQIRCFGTVGCLGAIVISPASTPALADSPMYREAMLDYHATFEDVEISLNAAGEHQFRTNIDRAGRFNAWRANVALSGIAPVTPDLDIGFNVSYGMDYYRFSSEPIALGDLDDPWDDIHTFNFGATLIYGFGPDLAVFGGPVFQFAGESGARFSDAFIGGGIVGIQWQFSQDITLGGGVGVVSQIKDSVRVFPVIMLDWQIIDDVRLSARTHHTAAGDIGGELIYDGFDGWEVAAGTVYRFRRFRLDKDGPEPEGIGQESALPVYGRITCRFNHNISASLYGGVVLAGELKLDDAAGNRIDREDYDPAGIIGLNVNIRF